jgi:hypothetical protein
MQTLLRKPALTLLLLVAGAFLTSAQAQSTGSPEWLPDGEWTTEDDPVEVFVQPDGDSAFVYDAANGSYGRAKQDDGDWRFKCPGMEQGDFYTLSGTTDDLGALQTVVENLVSKGQTTAVAPGVFEKAECIRSFWAHLDTLLTSVPPTEVPGREKPQRYATCMSSVYNATLHVPEAAEWYGVAGPTPGDTIAVYSPDGTCVGSGPWTPEGATLAVAGTDSLAGTPDGLAAGERMTLELYLADAGRAYPMTEVTWASCDTVSASTQSTEICAEGAYERGAYYEVAAADLIL